MKYSTPGYPNLLPDRNRERQVVFYGRVSTEHEAQISALAKIRCSGMTLKPRHTKTGKSSENTSTKVLRERRQRKGLRFLI